MQERQVTIGRETHKVPDPFLVMATQNPIETEGTYALPEAQVDRFMMKVLITYPSEMDEFVVVERMTGALPTVQPVLTTEQLIVLTARALAFMRGRSYVLAQDLSDVAVDVLRHRIVLSYEALSDDVTSDTLVAKVMERIPVPTAPMQGHALAR